MGQRNFYDLFKRTAEARLALGGLRYCGYTENAGVTSLATRTTRRVEDGFMEIYTGCNKKKCASPEYSRLTLT